MKTTEYQITVTKAELEAHRASPSMMDIATLEMKRTVEAMIDDSMRSLEMEDERRATLRLQLDLLDRDYSEMMEVANLCMAAGTFTSNDARNCIKRIEAYQAGRNRITEQLNAFPFGAAQ